MMPDLEQDIRELYSKANRNDKDIAVLGTNLANHIQVCEQNGKTITKIGAGVIVILIAQAILRLFGVAI